MWLLISAVVLIAWAVSRYLRMTQLQRAGFKGPKPHFIFGHSRELFSGENIKFVGKCLEEYGNTVALYVGGRPMLYTIDEDLLKMTQIKDFQLFMDRMLFVKGAAYPNKVTMSHVITAQSNRWREMRSILTPTFSASKLKQMNPEISDAVTTLSDNIGKQSGNGGKEFNIYPLYQGLTMDVIGRSAFGIRTNAQLTDTHPFIEHSKNVLGVHPTALLALNMWFPELTFILYPMRVMTRIIWEIMSTPSFQYLHSACRHILMDRRSKKGDRRDLLQAMIDAKMSTEQLSKTTLTVSSDMSETVNEDVTKDTKSGKGFRTMSDDEIVGNAFVFMEAGYETTSTTLAYLTHIMVNHEDVQDRMREEVLELIAKEKKIDYNSLTGLPYMEAVIYETLRLFPPVTYFVNRVASQNYPYKGLVIPKGTAVVAAVPQIHRNAQFWTDPDKFDAERFYKDNKKLVNPVHWQPFGNGPRNCIGMRFALLEIKLALADILQKYKLVPGPNTEMGKLELRLKSNLAGPKNGIKVKAIPI